MTKKKSFCRPDVWGHYSNLQFVSNAVILFLCDQGSKLQAHIFRPTLSHKDHFAGAYKPNMWILNRPAAASQIPLAVLDLLLKNCKGMAQILRINGNPNIGRRVGQSKNKCV